MTKSNVNSVGVGYENGVWIVDFGFCMPNDNGQDDAPRCALTGGQGTNTPPQGGGGSRLDAGHGIVLRSALVFAH